MEPGGSLPRPRQPTTSPYREPDESNLRSSMLLEICFHIAACLDFISIYFILERKILRGYIVGGVIFRTIDIQVTSVRKLQIERYDNW